MFCFIIDGEIQIISADSGSKITDYKIADTVSLFLRNRLIEKFITMIEKAFERLFMLIFDLEPQEKYFLTI